MSITIRITELQRSRELALKDPSHAANEYFLTEAFLTKYGAFDNDIIKNDDTGEWECNISRFHYWNNLINQFNNLNQIVSDLSYTYGYPAIDAILLPFKDSPIEQYPNLCITELRVFFDMDY